MEGFHRGCLVAAIMTAVVAFTVFRFLPSVGSRPPQSHELKAVKNSPDI
jgi:hypothetical protein